MTTRDPRSRDSMPGAPGAPRDPTQSLSIDPDDDVSDADDFLQSLALGTHEAREQDERTRIESPGGRVKTPAPARPVTRPPPLPTTDDPDSRMGSIVGNYKVAELLGKGGMGYVYRAEHTKLGREVALKLLRTDYAKRKDAVARFIQEARTVNRIRHRNIVDVPDILELDDGTTIIVMEYLRGTSLGKWARTGIDLPRALAVLVQICDGLAAAHAVSIVHRDLKPDNVFIIPTSDGAELVKLLDFGVAKLLNHGDEDIGFQTAAGSVIGTPAYMSPEQAGGMAIDARSDIYSLGAIMYELFCGQPMFRGRSFGEYVRKHLTEQPVQPRATQGGAQMDERLEAVILHALQKDPNQRFQSIVELREALLHLLGGLETMPPQYGTMTASGIRPAPSQTPLPGAMLSTMIPAAMLPTQLPVHVTGSGPHSNPSQLSSQWSQYPAYSQVVGPPLAPASSPTPWWVWFIGGALAVGLGVGAAVFYVGGDEPHVAPPAPVVARPATILAPTEPAPVAVVKDDPRPALTEPTVPSPRPNVTLRFDSLPSGGVYRAGESSELCQTPCELSERPDAGHQTYVVKAEGYKDGTIEVDLTAPAGKYPITLAQLPGGKKSTRTTKKPPKKVEGKVETAPPVVVEPAKTEEPAVEKKPPKKTGDKIDRSDTLDPFRKKNL